MKNRRLFALACLLLLLPCLILPVSANSAQQHWSGTDTSGAIITDGDCPIVVESELLTFDLSEFPSNYYSDEEEFLEYSGKVTAEYTFYNPSDMTVTATLAFPFGNLPDYGYGYDNVDKYGVTVNGEQVETSIRHTPYLYSYSNKRFDLDGSLDLLKNDYIKDGIYSPDTTVTVYYWKVEYDIKEGEKITHPRVALDIPKGDGSRVIYMENQSCGHLQEDGDYRIGGASPILYVIGEALDKMPEWKAYANGGCENGEEIDAEFTLHESQSMTLLDFALERREEDNPISDMDWYNITVYELINGVRVDGYPITSIGRGSGEINRWYQYEITLEPGEKLVNTVTAPMYPAIDMSYVPTVFEYTYLVSPASTWADFGELKIVINTPYYLTESSYEGFEKTESGYELTLDGLPTDDEGKVKDFIFSMSTEESPVLKSRTPEGIMKNIVYFFAFFGLPILIGIAVLAVIILIIKKIRRK